MFISIPTVIPNWSIFTPRKRGLGQGNIFAPVCHSVHGGRVLGLGGVPGPGGGAWSWEGLQAYNQGGS